MVVCRGVQWELVVPGRSGLKNVLFLHLWVKGYVQAPSAQIEGIRKNHALAFAFPHQTFEACVLCGDVAWLV